MREQAKWGKGALLIVVLAMAMAMAIASAPVRAETWLGVAGGFYEPAEPEAVGGAQGVYGIRAGHRLSPSFGLEAALSEADLTDTLQKSEVPDIPGLDFKFELQIYHVDLSVQWYPWKRGFLVFGGGGMSRLEAQVTTRFLGETDSGRSARSIFTGHAGAAYEWSLGDRLFVRPEARYRYLFSDDKVDQGDNLTAIYDASGPEASLVLGWRLGPRK
jgi:hypothetical protein